MTEFISRKYGNAGYEVIIKTDSHGHYKAAEDFARRLIGHAKPMTNAERIRTMTDEELGKFLMQAHDGALEIPFCKDRDECFDDIDAITNAKCMACMMGWIHQPAEDK